MNSQKIIQKYAKNHTKQETLDYFMTGDGASQIDFGLTMFPRKIAEFWQSAQDDEAETDEAEADDQPQGSKVITLRMYAQDGKALYQYVGLTIQCRGQITSREFAVKLARRTAERCNQFQAMLVFEHGRQSGDDDTTFQAMSAWTDHCLSREALAAVEAELKAARYQSEWGGLRRSYQ